MGLIGSETCKKHCAERFETWKTTVPAKFQGQHPACRYEYDLKGIRAKFTMRFRLNERREFDFSVS